jgi:hypothetical protein
MSRHHDNRIRPFKTEFLDGIDMKRRPNRLAIFLTAMVVAVVLVILCGRPIVSRMKLFFSQRRSVDDVIREYAAAAHARFAPSFETAGVVYPPSRLALLAMKSERMLEVWADDGNGWKFIRSYPIQAASGKFGPKLREGDRQVPEGIYLIAGLNPNSSYHLSMKLDYPNEFDRRHAAADGRTNLGGDIFIHGKSASVGCLAMGDPAIEELFVMVHDTGQTKVDVAVAPGDPRANDLHPQPGEPAWVSELYETIATFFLPFVRGSL